LEATDVACAKKKAQQQGRLIVFVDESVDADRKLNHF
jgi:hypothetical protein